MVKAYNNFREELDYLLQSNTAKLFKETVRKNYYITTTGKVFSESKHNKTVSIMKLSKREKGYLIVTIAGKHYRVHRLVCKMFLDDYDENSQVNHINLNKEDNSIENLEMCNNEENILHHYHSRKLKSSCLSVDDIRNSKPFSDSKTNQTQVLEFYEILKSFIGEEAFYCKIYNLNISAEQ